MTDDLSAANDLASGSQDLSALAGLFCTDGVESNALATQTGYGTVVASSLSLLGMLGLVKSTIKIALGLEACSNAGLSLDSLRGVYGYRRGEITSEGKIYECYDTKVRWIKEGGTRKLQIQKTERLLCDKTTPMVGVGADWEEGLRAITAFNLGSPRAEKGPFKNGTCIVLAALLCSGATSWSLMVVEYPWTWTKILAMPVLHVCLLITLAIPLLNERQVGRPYHYCKFDAVDFLIRTPGITNYMLEMDDAPVNARSSSRFLQVNMKGGDVIHFQSPHSFVGTPLMRIVAFLVSGLSAVAYLCQYVILKSASNKRSAIWIGIQGFMALMRISYWMSDPKFDDPKTEFAEYAMMNNTSFDGIMTYELVCAVLPNGTAPVKIPVWALNYVFNIPLRHILAQVMGEHPHVPTDAGTEIYVFENVNFERILRNRLGNNEPPTTTEWKLGVWRHSSKPEVTPFLLVSVPFSEIIDNIRVTRWGWMQISHGLKGCRSNIEGEEFSIVEPETILSMRDGRRVTITSYSDSSADKAAGTLQEHPSSYRYLRDRSRDVHDWLKIILERRQALAKNDPQALLPRAVNIYSHRLWIVATNNTIDRKHGIARVGGQILMPSTSEQLWYPQQCLDRLQEYIEEPSSGHVVGDRPSKSATEKRPAHTISSV